MEHFLPCVILTRVQCAVQNLQVSTHPKAAFLFPAVHAVRRQVLDPDLEARAASHLCRTAINFVEETGAAAAHCGHVVK